MYLILCGGKKMKVIILKLKRIKCDAINLGVDCKV